MMSVHERACLFVLLLGTLATAACNEKQYDETKPYNDPVDLTPRPEGEKQPLSRAGTPLDRTQQASTAHKLAEARCDREERCNKVGDGRKYASRATCLAAVTSEWSEELNEYHCPGGTVQGALDNCLKEIRGEGCVNPLASLERIVDCDAHEVCRNPDPRP